MDIKVGRNWGLFAAGIALVIIGFVLLMVPGLTLVSIAVIAGCMFLAAGIVDAYAYFKYREAEGLSGWALAYAICDIILGVLFIVHPIASAVVIPWVMGIFVVAYGIFEIVAASATRFPAGAGCCSPASCRCSAVSRSSCGRAPSRCSWASS